MRAALADDNRFGAAAPAEVPLVAMGLGGDVKALVQALSHTGPESAANMEPAQRCGLALSTKGNTSTPGDEPIFGWSGRNSMSVFAGLQITIWVRAISESSGVVASGSAIV